MSTRMIGALAAALFGAAAGVTALASPAAAASCPQGKGVTVVVNSTVRCDANGGGAAASNFGDAGFTLSNYRGFVCSIDGSPDPAQACHSYAPADAYWALFWSNGTSGEWTYASSGAYSLNVPQGGWVAFKFQTSTTKSYPGVTPYTAPATPKPTPTPQPKPKPKPAPTSDRPSTGAPSPTVSPSADEAPADSEASKGKKKDKKKDEATATPEVASQSESTGDVVVASASEESDSSMTSLWWGGALAALLMAGIGATIWQRRARES